MKDPVKAPESPKNKLSSLNDLFYEEVKNPTIISEPPKKRLSSLNDLFDKEI